MSGRLSRLREDLQQRRHHRAFRIAPLPSDDPSREELARLLASVAASVTDPGVEQQASVESPLEEKALAEAATNLWRAQRRLTRQGEEASTRSRQTGRYLRSCREALDEAGLLVQEHEGDAFHAGRSLEALAFEDDPSLEADTVRETIRPTIYLHGRRIQMGQVIVGCPPKPPEPVEPVELSKPLELPESPEPEDSVPAPAIAPAPVSEAPSSSDHERTDHA